MNEQYNKIQKKLLWWFFWFWIKKRRFTFILVWIIVFLWVSSMISIPKESSPEIDFWVVSISTLYQWATPQDIDNLITNKIEKEIKDISWIKKISSTSSSSISNIMIEFENDADMTQSLVDIKDAVDKINLPSDAETPVVQDISVNNEMMFSVLIYWDQDKFSQFYLKDKWRKIKANLEWNWSINSIDFDSSMDMSLWSVNGNGDSFYEIEVWLDRQKIEEVWLSLAQISQNIKNRNSNQPLWTHTIWELWYDFRIQWEIKNIEELWEIPIQTNNGYVKLKDISKIQKKLKSNNIQKMWSYQLSWQNYVNLFFNKQAWDNIFSSSKTAKELFEKEFEKTEYKWLSYVITMDLWELINDDYNTLAKNWLQTLILVFIALLIFVWFKESLIATITLPLAFFITFIVLKNLGLSLNFLTNFSFIVTFWIAIDTTIVVIEWAHEKMRQWFKPMNSILLAVKEYKTPLIAGTATTIAVFIPLLTLPGIMWKFLAYIPITIFSTLVAALLISLTINSALYYKLSKPRKYFNSNIWDTKHMKKENKILLEEDKKWKIEKPENKKDKREKILDQISLRYSEKLWQIINNPRKRVLSAVIPIIALVLSLVFISPNLWFQLFPESDNWYLTLEIKWPSWSTKEYMQKYNKDLENILSSQPEIKVYYSNIAGDSINTNIELFPEDIRKNKKLKSSSELETYLDKNLKYLQSEGLDVVTKAEQNGPPTSKPVWIKLITNNSNVLNTLNKVSIEFENYLKSIPWTKNIESSSQKSPGQFVYKFDKTKLTLLWLNPNSFAYELFWITNWISAWTIKWKYDDHDIKLYVDDKKDNINPQTLNEININTTAGKVNFGNIGDYSFEKSIQSISRENNKITISIWADIQEWAKADQIQSKLQEFAKNYEYPQDINYSMWWESEENMDLIQAIIVAFVVAIIFIFGILVSQFNSYIQPIIILYSVMIGLLWANIWLWITNLSYSLMFGIWFIALTGIIVNDAIVLIDRTNNNIEKWMNKTDAIKEAGKARLQPIILTTLTTFLWLISIVWDPMWRPLAITIMVWIIFGSAVTLFVIPNIYFDKEKIRHTFRRSILRYLILLIIPVLITIAVMFVLMVLNISISWMFGSLLIAIFIWFGVWYSFYTIHAWSTNWQTIIQKMLGLKILNINWKIMTEKQATKRFFTTILILVWPLLAGLILWWIISLLSKEIWIKVWIFSSLILYMIIMTKNLIYMQDENKSITDIVCKTKTIDKNLYE